VHKTIKEDFNMILKLIAGAVIGGLLGYLYHKKVGCKSGTCPITSSRNGSTIYGAIIGLLLSSSF
jgi:prolipoprotein diacylglyceryltransferase